MGADGPGGRAAALRGRRLASKGGRKTSGARVKLASTEAAKFEVRSLTRPLALASRQTRAGRLGFQEPCFRGGGLALPATMPGR